MSEHSIEAYLQRKYAATGDEELLRLIERYKARTKETAADREEKDANGRYFKV